LIKIKANTRILEQPVPIPAPKPLIGERIMSSYKSLLTILADPDQAKATLDSAANYAQKLDAHLDVLAIGVDLNQLGYSYLGGGAVIMPVLTDQAENDARTIAKTAEAALVSKITPMRYAIETAVTQQWSINDLVGARARYSDLTILQQPYGVRSNPVGEAIVEAALFQGHSSVIILPETKPLSSSLPKRIVIAWNQKDEALRAVRASLAMLQAADWVTVTVIDPPKNSEERSDPGGMLCQMLARHGVRAEVTVLARSLPRISDVLARHVLDTNADMVVMGAYGHSRWRESILGGTTRNMLEMAQVPVFMVH
jgi:nucleotide-binding universal stress UspA family protein